MNVCNLTEQPTWSTDCQRYQHDIFSYQYCLDFKHLAASKLVFLSLRADVGAKRLLSFLGALQDAQSTWQALLIPIKPQDGRFIIQRFARITDWNRDHNRYWMQPSMTRLLSNDTVIDAKASSPFELAEDQVASNRLSSPLPLFTSHFVPGTGASTAALGASPALRQCPVPPRSSCDSEASRPAQSSHSAKAKTLGPLQPSSRDHPLYVGLALRAYPAHPVWCDSCSTPPGLKVGFHPAIKLPVYNWCL